MIAFSQLWGCMSAPASVARVLRFDSFELDLHAGELRKGGIKVRLQGRPVQLLGILLQNAGSLVTREELRSQLWAADTFVDFDHGMHNAIARIREALGDCAEGPRYVETLPRRGYRFIAAVEELQAHQTTAANGKHSETEILDISSIPAPKKRPRLVFILGSSVAIAIAAFFGWQHSHAKAAAPPIRSIAVLPLQNMSGDPNQEYFADGMTEELITELSRIQELKVISHTSVAEYKGTRKHLPQIARELGADGIVEGSVLREGDHMRVTVQLLDAPNDRHLWSEDYQRPVRGVLALQSEVAQAIAQQIRVKLAPKQQASGRSTHVVDPESYDAYLRGRYYITTNYTKLPALNTAKSFFEQSARKDPGFAPAYSSLAETYLFMAFYRHLSPEIAFRSAKEAVDKALDLDGSLGQAHSDLALMNWQYERDWPRAEREFDQAIALAPSYDCVRAYHSNYLAWKGQRAEAFAELTKARELNPGSSFAATESAAYFLLQDYPGLVEAARRGIASDPNDWSEHFFLGLGYEGLGKRAEAIPEYQKAVEMSRGDQDPTAALAHVYAAVGRRAEAEKILHDLEQPSKQHYVSPYMVATIYAGLGDKDKAFELLGKAYAERSLDIVWNLKADLRLNNLRSDPRFDSLYRRMGFVQ